MNIFVITEINMCSLKEQQNEIFLFEILKEYRNNK